MKNFLCQKVELNKMQVKAGNNMCRKYKGLMFLNIQLSKSVYLKSNIPIKSRPRT